MRFCELQNKEVVNVATGVCLGYICDMEFEEQSGCIRYIYIPGPGKLCGILGRDGCYCIDYRCIVCIGPDIVLVNVKDLELNKKNK